MDAMDGNRIGEDKLELRGFCIRMQMATHQYEMTHFVEGADRQAVIDATASCGVSFFPFHRVSSSLDAS